MLTTVNFCYGNLLYIVRRAKLTSLLFVKPLAFLRIQDGGHLNITMDFDPVSKNNPRNGLSIHEKPEKEVLHDPLCH